MDLELQDRRVLVTGGSQGIGLAVARGFLREGAIVTIVSRDRARSDDAVSARSAMRPSILPPASAASAETAASDRARSRDTMVTMAPHGGIRAQLRGQFPGNRR